jgi:LCP family protein required for cell wall assembly
LNLLVTDAVENDQPVPRNKRHRLRHVVIALIAVVVLAVGVVAVYGLSLSRTFDNAQEIATAFPAETLRPTVPDPPKAVDGTTPTETAQNIMLLGSDTRGSTGPDVNTIRGQRSDTIMVVHIPADRKTIQVMSIMRDSWVPVAGYGDTKVNAALSYGGVPLAVQTVEGLINVRIDHVAVVDFQGFKGITDALGGVEVDNPIAFSPLHLQGQHFAAGPIQLNGDQALAFVRERYAFSDGDFQRVRNQQLFIKSVVKKTLTAQTLANPIKISGLIGALVPYLAVDSGFDSGYAAGLAYSLRNLRASDITFFTMPTLGTGMIQGQSIVKVDWNELAVIKERFRADTLNTYAAKYQTMG